MSVESLAAVLHHSRARGTVKLVMVGIANHDGDGGSYPAVSTLARYANCEPRTVQRALERLVSLGELAVEVQEGGSRDVPDHRRPNRYHVRVACPPWCDRTTQHRDTRESRQANLELSTRVTALSPHRRGRGDATVTRTGDSTVTQTITKNQTTEVSTQPQYARGWCTTCNLSRLACSTLQGKTDDAHEYVEGNHRAQG